MNIRKKEEVEKIISSYGYILRKDYMLYNGVRNIRRVDVEDKDGYRYDVPLRSFVFKNKNISFVETTNPYSIYNIERWIHKMNKPFKLETGSFYKNRDVKLNFYCFNCTETFSMTWGNIKSGHGCGYCSGNTVGKYNNLEYLYPDLIKEWDNSNEIEPRFVMPNSHEKYNWKCLKCKTIWGARPNDRVSQNQGCPKCRESKGEKIISNFLIENKIEFIPQFTFDDCVDIRKLEFDFYICGYNVPIIVEYDGEFHYYDIMNNPKKFKKGKRRDRIKNKYCKKNNIYLLRIPYWKFSEIEKILNETLLS